jgi:hypothetical protein
MPGDPPRRFEDDHVDADGRLSLGADLQTGGRFLSIPVSNARVDYEEFYRLDEAEYVQLRADRDAARAFAEACRARRHDDRLILQPGTDRGGAR